MAPPLPPATSVFLRRPASEHVASNALAFAIRDGFPVSPGHTLVVPRRVVATWFDASADEQRAIFELVEVVKRQLDAELAPDGYNIGINVGEAGGQTVMHLHVHVIPRFTGDVDDPRGGVRFVVPEAGNYKRPGHIPRRPGAGTPDSGGPSSRLATGGRRDPFRWHIGPLLAAAQDVAILAAFARDSGVRALAPDLAAALDRGGRVRVLTGDYLNLTQAHALRRLLDLQRAEAAVADADDSAEDRTERGVLEVRVVEERHRLGLGSTFHPKSWIFLGGPADVAYVGSSNLSHAALTDGVEWNLRLERDADPAGFDEVLRAFEAWWDRATAIDEDWVEDYARRARLADRPLPEGEADEADRPPPEPRDVQREALTALAHAREAGRDRAIVVLATGLGKTWLAAFDVARFAVELGRTPRVLFVAHREELLRHAASTLRRRFPDARFGWFAGPWADLQGDFVFASVQKLARPNHLATLPRDAFDYVIVDEVHHADAPTWRRLLDHLVSRFRLGLTATPDRGDGGDIHDLFDDFVAFTADIGVGVTLGHLVPFHYLGLKDDTDYAQIPWRNGRFDAAALAEAVQTQRRMERLWQAWSDHPGDQTLVFTCSIAHATFVGRWLAERGVRAAVVHSGPGSADRARALTDLDAGALDALVTVDLFNEGVDLPTLDRVVMLRPTESPIVFLQQLGRGLRCAPGKERLTVVDFVGNHRVFLQRMRTLVNLGAAPGGPVPVAAWLAGDRDAALPPGCSVDVELEAIALLARLLPSGAPHALVAAYREHRAVHGQRPRVGDLARQGFNPRSLKSHDSWFDLVAAEGDLSDPEAAALASARAFLVAVERGEAMTKSFKMVALEALLEEDALLRGLDLETLCARSRAIMLRSPELEADLGAKELGDVREMSAAAWQTYWTRWPLRHWTTAARAPFRLTAERFEPTFSVPAGAAEALSAMTRELVDYRLWQYRRRRAAAASSDGVAFEAKLIRNARGPILMLPDRARAPGVPSGPTDVRLPDGRSWTFRFARIAVNVAGPVGAGSNELADLLRGWFGPAAGQPGTSFRVRFAPSPDGWWVAPVEAEDAQVIGLPARGRLVTFPSLRAAAGWTGEAVEAGALEADEVALPGAFDRERCFAVRASGDSMTRGGIPWRADIRDGDWLIFRWARGERLGALLNRVALVARRLDDDTQSFHVKRIAPASSGRDGGLGVVLASDNPDHPAMAAGERDEAIALLVDVVRPEAMAPAAGERVADDELAAVFGLSAAPNAGASRVDGHLFVLAEGAGALAAPDRVRHARGGLAPHPGETAFVLTRAEGESLRYAGVGRFVADEEAWAIPEVDFATWRALGRDRSASRRLAAEWRERAERLVAELLVSSPAGTWLEAGGRRARVVGRAARGGVRIDGGPGGFAERTVTLTDLAWALAARDEARLERAVCDEARVNRLRYLDGTPKGSTRWIDTGWALLLTEASA